MIKFLKLNQLEGLANEDDWATKAKEWAAAKSVVTDNHQIQQHGMPMTRTELHHYAHNDQYQPPAGLPAEPLHPPIPQSSSDQLSFQMTGQHRETNYLQGNMPCCSCSIYVTDGYVSFRTDLKIVLQIEVQWRHHRRVLVHFHPPMSRRYLIIILLLQVCLAWQFNLLVWPES